MSSVITALIVGHLSQTPISRTTSKGGTMATGSLAVNASNDGEQKERWQIIVDALLPGPGKPQATKTAPRSTKGHTHAAHRFQSPPEPPPFDDALF